MNMENFTSVFNSADGPTSIFVAGKTPEIMGVLIAIVVVGVIISLFGLKLVRVLSAMMGLGTGAVIGAVIGTVAGLDTTKMVATIAVCGVVLCIMCAVLRKFGIFVMTFFGSWGTFVTQSPPLYVHLRLQPHLRLIQSAVKSAKLYHIFKMTML